MLSLPAPPLLLFTSYPFILLYSHPTSAVIRVYLPQLKLISQQQSVSARLRRGSTVERAKNAIRMQWMSNEVHNQEMRDSFVTLDSDSEGEEDTPKKPAGGDWDDNSDDGHDDGWTIGTRKAVQRPVTILSRQSLVRSW